MTQSSSEIIICQGREDINLDVRLEGEIVWLDGHQMAQLFGRDRTVIVCYIGNIYKTNQLDLILICVKNTQVAADNALLAISLLITKIQPDEKDLLSKVPSNSSGEFIRFNKSIHT